MFCPFSKILHLGFNSSCKSVQTHAAAAPFCSFASAQREQWPPPLQHCSSVDSRTMAANPAPLHIYIYTKSYRNFKVGGGGWCVGGEGLSATVGLSFLLITDRLEGNKPGPLPQPLWVWKGGAPASLLADFTSLCLPVSS